MAWFYQSNTFYKLPTAIYKIFPSLDWVTVDTDCINRFSVYILCRGGRWWCDGGKDDTEQRFQAAGKVTQPGWLKGNKWSAE